MSTSFIASTRGALKVVKVPLMPKGVEHVPPGRAQRQAQFVKVPLMPKGVEHTKDPQLAEDLAQVKVPLMPKGVEHI